MRNGAYQTAGARARAFFQISYRSNECWRSTLTGLNPIAWGFRWWLRPEGVEELRESHLDSELVNLIHVQVLG